MEHKSAESEISLKKEPTTSAFTIPTTTTIRYPSLSPGEGTKIEENLTVPPTLLGTRRRRSSSSRTATAKQKEPAVVARRNARERRRVKMVNDGFIRLRKHVPTDPKNKKLSKVKTLRSAIDYIRQLQQMLSQTSKPLTSEELDPAANSSWLSAADMKLNQDEYQEALFGLQRAGARQAVIPGQTFCSLD